MPKKQIFSPFFAKYLQASWKVMQRLLNRFEKGQLLYRILRDNVPTQCSHTNLIMLRTRSHAKSFLLSCSTFTSKCSFTSKFY